MSAKKAIIVRSGEPIVQLRPPQRRVFRHKSGILFFIWRRQCGKSYALAIQALDKMMSKPGVSVIFMSASLRLGQENILKEAMVWRDVLAAMRKPIEGAGLKLTSTIDDLGIDDVAELFEKQKLEARIWHNRTDYSRSLTIAPNPDTAVGFTGWLVLDEVGRMPEFQAVYEAAEPFVSSSAEFEIRGATTPPPDDTHYSYELLCPPVGEEFPVSPTGNFYRSPAGVLCHRADAYDLHAAGIPLFHPDTRKPITPEDARARAWDKQAWDRNYGCQFLKGGTAAISETDIRHAMVAGHGQALAINITDTLSLPQGLN